MAVCAQCNIELAPDHGFRRFCSPCDWMWDVVAARSWFTNAQAEWLKEEEELKRRIKRLKPGENYFG